MKKQIISSLLLAGMAFATPSTAFAQEAAAPAATQPANAPGWVKACDKTKEGKQVCVVNYQLRSQTGQPLASLALREIEGVNDKFFVLAVPPGMLLQPGMRFQIDGSKQETVKYQICFPNACFGEAKYPAEFVSQLKRGNEIKLTTLTQQGKTVSFPITLSGFTKAYDGEPLDPAALQQDQDALQNELQKRAEEARKKLLEEGAEKAE